MKQRKNEAMLNERVVIDGRYIIKLNKENIIEMNGIWSTPELVDMRIKSITYPFDEGEQKYK